MTRPMGPVDRKDAQRGKRGPYASGLGRWPQHLKSLAIERHSRRYPVWLNIPMKTNNGQPARGVWGPGVLSTIQLRHLKLNFDAFAKLSEKTLENWLWAHKITWRRVQHSLFVALIYVCGAWGLELCTWSVGTGVMYMEPGDWIYGCGTWGLDLRMWDLGTGVTDVGPGDWSLRMWDLGTGVTDVGPGDWSYGCQHSIVVRGHRSAQHCGTGSQVSTALCPANSPVIWTTHHIHNHAQPFPSGITCRHTHSDSFIGPFVRPTDLTLE
eukprot:Em0590g1a